METETYEHEDQQLEEEEVRAALLMLYLTGSYLNVRAGFIQDAKDTIQIKLQNIVATVNLGVQLDLVSWL